MDIFLSAAAIEITPRGPMPLAGFAERQGVYSDVKDRLEINLVVLKQEDRQVLIYSVDALFVPEEFVEIVLDKFGTKYQLDKQNIWMTATHTHYAPALDNEKPALGKLDAEHYEFVKEQLLLLTEQVLTSTYKKVKIEYGDNKSKLNVNRRKKLLRPKGMFSFYRKVLMFPDYNGVKDDNIHVLKFVDEQGATAFVLWNYACHPVGYPHLNTLTAEFVGAIRQQMRKLYSNENMPVSFLIGFAGNLKPDLTCVTHTRWKDKLKYFFQLGPKFMRFPNTAFYTAWVEMLWQEVKIALEHTTQQKNTTVQVTQYEMPLNEIIGNTAHTVQFKKLQLADRLELVGVSAEVFSEYTHLLAGDNNRINVGCLAGTRIYLPTDENVKQGGYEVHGFQHKFSISGVFKRGLDEKIKSAVSQL